MQKRNVTQQHNTISVDRKKSIKEIQAKLQRRKDIEELRKEKQRVQAEELRVKKLQDKNESQDDGYFTKAVENKRRSWILGTGNASPTNEKTVTSPKIDSRRQKYNKAMRKLEKYGRLSTRSDSSDTSISSEPSTSAHRPYERHSTIYHSSQFQVSSLVSQEKKTKKTELPKASVICRICQSDEDSLKNQLVTPCSCIGSLQYVHHLCLQQWRKTKRASGADISSCELCLQNYNTEMLGDTDVKPDETRKMQEDLRRLVRSGVYLMLLVDFCRDSFQELLSHRDNVGTRADSVPVAIHPNSTTERARRDTVPELGEEDSDSSEDNEDYVSRAQVKQRSRQLHKHQ